MRIFMKIPSYMSPPDNIRKAVENTCNENESVLLWLKTDINTSGNFTETWVAVSSDRLLTVHPDGGTPEIDRSYALKDLTKVNAVNRTGYVALEVETQQTREDVARASNARAGTFHQVARGINERDKHDGHPQFDLDDEEEQFCPSCGKLLPEKGSFCPACLKRRKVLARIWEYMKPHWPKAALMSVMVTLAAGFSVAPPYLTKILVDDVLHENGDTSLLLIIVLALGLTRFLTAGLRIFQGRIASWLGSRIMHDVRFDLYQSIQALTFRRFDRTQTGTLMSRLLHDTTRLNYMLTDFGAWFIPTILQLVGILGMLVYMDWFLAIFMLIPMPIFVFGMTWFHKMIHRLFHRHWKRRDRMSAVANDSISGLRVVKAFAQEPKEIGKFQNRSWSVYEAAAEQEQAFATFFPALDLVVTSGSLLIWYFGGQMVLGNYLGHDQITLGTLVAFIGYLSMFYGPLDWITSIANHINSAITAAQRLFEIIDAEQEVYDDPKAVKLENLQGHVEFDNVRFGYRKDKEVLKGISLDIEPGEMVGLVGRSGVGKTTMTNLVCRFYDVNEGAIKIDGTDLRDINIGHLRRQIGIVPQESFLFNGTVSENIAYAQPDAKPRDIIRASIAANALGFVVRQSDGFDTKVGEHGGRLSGGEKQRVAIARAILHDPKILILDEATSSVDTDTEDQIQTALRRLVKGRTTFAIAHRLSTLKYADRLVVLEEGKVVETGTHDELVEKDGVYAGLVSKQSKLSAIRAVEG